MSTLSTLEELAYLLRDTQRLVVLTGAGISHESGIPTFRGPEGLWRNFRPEELATPAAFARHPELVWEWYHWRRRLIHQARPNPAHYALADLEERFTDFTLITQNVDGLHALAGSRRLIEIHGSIWEVRCTSCQTITLERRLDLPPLPRCSACGGLLRPNVVWFGESLDADRLAAATAALHRAQIMLIIGTSAVVQPAASFALWAKQAGARLAEFNPNSTPLTPHCHFTFQGQAGDLLPTLLHKVRGGREA